MTSIFLSAAPPWGALVLILLLTWTGSFSFSSRTNSYRRRRYVHKYSYYWLSLPIYIYIITIPTTTFYFIKTKNPLKDKKNACSNTLNNNFVYKKQNKEHKLKLLPIKKVSRVHILLEKIRQVRPAKQNKKLRVICWSRFELGKKGLHGRFRHILRWLNISTNQTKINVQLNKHSNISTTK